MRSATKISLLIFWLIIVQSPAALAELHLACNVTGDGELSIYSEGIDHRMAATSSGPSEHYIEINMVDAMSSSVFQGLNATERGTIMAQSPEYTVRAKATRGIYGTTSLTRESEIEETRELIAEYNDTLVRTTRTVQTDAAVATSIHGNAGQFSEDIDITTIGKARALKLRELDGNGSFNLTTDLQLSGAQIKRDFGRLNETEAFDRRVVMAHGVDEDGVITQPLGGV